MEIKIYLQRTIIVLVAGFLMLASCKKETSGLNYIDKPVVEAFLVPGQPLSVRVYSQKDLTDTAVYGTALTGLSLSVSDGSKTVKLTEAANGVYTDADLSFITSGKTYTLQFTYDNAIVSAKTVMPGKPVGFTLSDSIFYVPVTIDPAYATKVLATAAWTNPDSLDHVLLFKNTDSDPFNITTVRSNNKPSFQINTEGASIYNMTQSRFNYYGHYQVILLRVNEEYINLLKSNASGSSQNLTNPPTNVVNGLGIFTAMQADTLALRVTLKQ